MDLLWISFFAHCTPAGWLYPSKYCFILYPLAHILLTTNVDTTHQKSTHQFSNSAQFHYCKSHLPDAPCKKYRSAEGPLKEGNLVCLSTKNINLLKGAWKLMSVFIGPYPIVKVNPDSYTLKPPIELEARNIYPTFIESSSFAYTSSVQEFTLNSYGPQQLTTNILWTHCIPRSPS